MKIQVWGEGLNRSRMAGLVCLVSLVMFSGWPSGTHTPHSGRTGPDLTESGSRRAPLENLYPEIAKLVAGDAQSGYDFGYSVALSGDTLVVGSVNAPGGPGDTVPNSGAVYVFERNLGGPDNWGQAAKLTASDAQEGDVFGGAVAISGDTLVVGANGEDGGPGDPWWDSGAAYVFVRDLGGLGNWGQVAKLLAGNAIHFGQFGISVAIDGDSLVVGADGDAGPPFPGSQVGAAYVYERDLGGADNWGLSVKLTSSNPQEGAFFGGCVAISGDTIAAGAGGEDGDPGDPQQNTGAVYLFERDLGGADNWGQRVRLDTTDSQAFDLLGWSVALSADTLVAGAAGEDGGPGDPLPESGAAYIFERDSGGADAWGQAAKLAASDAEAADLFGEVVSIHADTIVVGAYYEDGGPGDPLPDAGAAYVFERDLGGADTWGQAARLTASDAEAEDWFGMRATVDGDTLVVSARREAGGPGDPLPGAGAAYVYQKAQVGVALGPDQSDTGTPGGVVTYTVAITNTGTISDTFNLAVSGNSWATGLSADNITLAAGASMAFDVFVEIPAGAAHGSSDTATVTATSQIDASVSATTTLTTSAVAPETKLYLPLVIR